MDKLHRSQWEILIFIAFLTILTPFISTLLRPPYLYLLINLLIIALGAESGFLTSLYKAKPLEPKKSAHLAPGSAAAVAVSVSPHISSDEGLHPGVHHERSNDSDQKPDGSCENVVKKIITADMVKRVKKCPSMPSLFFIDGGDRDGDDFGEEAEEGMLEEEGDGLSSQEIFAKAEMFIGNFYKQLKIQREDSWKKIHGFYHRAF